MFEKFLERLRGSSRAPDDLALGTVRPGDFADDPASPEHEGEGWCAPCVRCSPAGISYSPLESSRRRSRNAQIGTYLLIF